jgi:leucyl aminopeptidase
MKSTQFEFNPRVSDLAFQIEIVDAQILASLPNYKSYEKLGFNGKYLETLLLPESHKLLIGVDFNSNLRTADPYYKVNPYQLGAVACLALKSNTLSEVVLSKIPVQFTTGDWIVEFILGFLQASLKFTTYKEPKKDHLTQVIGLSAFLNTALSEGQVRCIRALNEGITLNRLLVEATPEQLNPDTVVEILETMMPESVITKKYINYEQLLEMGADGITFVGRASTHKPLVVQYEIHPSQEIKKTIVLVGKGLTYDSGGMDIKTSHMKTMKCDMGGAGLMAGVMKVLTHMNLQHTKVIWISAFAENMIAGNAYKADDILCTLSGLTVEVFNTDAEGRLTLADALALATMENPDYIVDAATLTGAVGRALSDYYTGLMGNDAEFNLMLQQSFEATQERSQLLVMPEVLREQVKGSLSDLKNLGDGPNAGHITAGLFLSEFVNQHNYRGDKLKIDNKQEYSWIHLDIAGSAYNNKQNELNYEGATGHGVRALAHWVQTVDKQGDK